MNAVASPGRVTVVVASYNHAGFLPQRMDSLISQTYPDIEILVIDDCSTDNSVEVLRRYESDPRVRLVVRKENGGWVAVSNHGLHMASGEFVLFANCDDECEPRMIERLVASLVSQPTAALAFCRSVLIDEHGRAVGDDYSIREPAFREKCARDTLIEKSEMSRFLLYSCVVPNLSAALFRRDLLREIGGFSPDYRVCSDWDLFFRLCARHDGAYVAEPLNRFRQHSTTVRSATKERVVYGEYIRLILGEIRKRIDLTQREKVRFRTRAMSMWAGSLISRSTLGLKNSPHYVRLVARYDPLALLFVAPALAFRFAEVMKTIMLGGWRFISGNSRP